MRLPVSQSKLASTQSPLRQGLCLIAGLHSRKASDPRRKAFFRNGMIVRNSSSHFTNTSSSTSSTNSSLKTPSAFAEEWDADDEDAMSTADDYVPSRPLTVAIPTMGAHGPYCPRRPNLREILANTSPPPWTLAAFMAYLSNNHCLETLEFTMDSGRFVHFRVLS